MSGRHEDPVEILDDDSETAQEPEEEPEASTSAAGTKDAKKETIDDDPEEYTVEAIRARRRHPKTGVEEYYIKWEGFPEDENTWEPLENLKCPELIQKFKDDERNKRRRKKADKLANQPAKRLRRDTSGQESMQGSIHGSEDTLVDDSLFVENENDDGDEDVIQTAPQRGRPKNNKDTPSDQISRKGFKRGLPLERILSGSLGDDKKLYFFVKWQGRDALELVEADEVEEKASLELCKWYRHRLYWQSASPVEQ